MRERQGPSFTYLKRVWIPRLKEEVLTILVLVAFLAARAARAARALGLERY